MNSKRLSKRLNKIGYTLDRDNGGWIVRAKFCKFEHRFADLVGVLYFVDEEEALVASLEKKG